MVSSLDGEGTELTEPLLWADSGNSGKKFEKHAEYVKKINSQNAKFVAFCLVLGFICYHGIIHLRYGEYLGKAE